MSESHMMHIVSNSSVRRSSSFRERKKLRVRKPRLHFIDPLFITDHKPPYQFDLFVDFATKKEPPTKGAKEVRYP
jgi:hypothetical protein